MGKKKGKRKQYKYNKTQFIDILCSGCNVCGEYVEPSYCFDCCYKYDPVNFVNNIYKKLIRMRDWPVVSGEVLSKLEINVFKSTFCRGECCYPEFENGNKKQCDHIATCIERFHEQISNSLDSNATLISHVPRQYSSKKKRKQKQKKVVVQPYPTFVLSGSDAFRERVRCILYGKASNTKDNKQIGDQGLPLELVAGSNG